MTGKYLHPSIFTPLSVRLFNKVGANNVVSAAPAFPAPNIPNALPCQCLGYQTEVKAIPIAKLIPVSPKPKLANANPKKLSA